MPGSEIAGLCSNYMFSFLRNCQHAFQWLYHFAFPPSVSEWPSFSTFLLTFNVTIFFVVPILIVISHCSFNFAISWLLIMLNIFSCAYNHPSIKCLFVSFASFLIELFVFLLISFESCYILDTGLCWLYGLQILVYSFSIL